VDRKRFGYGCTPLECLKRGQGWHSFGCFYQHSPGIPGLCWPENRVRCGRCGWEEVVPSELECCEARD